MNFKKWFKEFIESLRKMGIDTSPMNFSKFLYTEDEHSKERTEQGYLPLEMEDINDNGIENVSEKTQEELFKLAYNDRLVVKPLNSIFQKDYVKMTVGDDNECIVDDSAAKKIFSESELLESGSQLLDDAELDEYKRIIAEAAEVSKSGLINVELKKGGTIEQLRAEKERLENAGTLSADDRKYLDYRIATEMFYKKLAEKKARCNPAPPTKQADGTLMFEDIVQSEFQSTWNGCYSCALSNMLKHMNFPLSQKQIRAYRGDQGDPRNDRVLGDNMGNIISIGGMVTQSLANKGMVEHTFPNLHDADAQMKAILKGKIKEVLNEAFVNNNSPVAILVGAHYRTIVGYNPQTETLTMKNSLSVTGAGDPNKNETCSIDALLNAKKLSLTHIVNIDPLNPKASMKKAPHGDFVNGKFTTFFPDDVGIRNEVRNFPDCVTINELEFLEDGTRLDTAYIMPSQLVYPDDVISQGPPGDQVKPKAEDPAKIALEAEIDEEIEKLSDVFPKGCHLAVSAKNELYVTEDKSSEFLNAKKQDLKHLLKYFYLRGVKDNMDMLTPNQVKEALAEETIKLCTSNIRKSTGYKEALQSFTPTDNKKARFGNLDEFYDMYCARKYLSTNLKNLRNCSDKRLTAIRNHAQKLVLEGKNINRNLSIRLRVESELAYFKKIPNSEIKIESEERLNQTVIPVNEVNMDEAGKWFEQFGTLLKSKGYDLDNPFSMAMISVTGSVDAQLYNSDVSKAGKDAVAQKLDILDNADSYAFMKHNHDGSYAVPRNGSSSNINWLKENMKTFDQVKSDPQHVAYLYSMFKSGRLFVSSPVLGKNTEISHNLMFSEPNGDLKFFSDYSHIHEGQLQTFDNADYSIYHERKAEIIRERLLKNPNLSKDDVRDIIVNHTARTYERRLCAAAINNPEIINSDTIDYYEKLIKQTDIPEAAKTENDKLLDNESVEKVVVDVKANKLLSNVRSITGEKSIKDIITSSKVRLLNGDPLNAKKDIAFFSEIVENSKDGKGLIIVGKENGTEKPNVYVADDNKGLVVGKHTKEYIQRITELSKALIKTDSMLSKDSDQYKNIKRELSRLQEQISSNKGKRYSSWPNLTNLYNACREYQDDKFSNVIKLSDRQQKRLGTISEILDFCKMSEDRVTNPCSVEYRKQALADRLVSAYAIDTFKNDKTEKKYSNGRNVLVSEKCFSEKRNEIVKSDAFMSMVAGKDAKQLEEMYSMGGAEILKHYQRLEKSFNDPANELSSNSSPTI